MTPRSFSLEFTDTDYAVIEQALMIDEEFFNNRLKEMSRDIVEVAHAILLDFVNRKLYEENPTKKIKADSQAAAPTKTTKKAEKVKIASPMVAIPVATKNALVPKREKDVIFDFVDCDWKDKALMAVLEADEQHRAVSSDEILNMLGVSPSKKKCFQCKLGHFFKKSNVKRIRKIENGTTRTSYCLY